MKKTILLGALLIAIAFQSANAQESKFKALFIYKFAEYIEWPGGSKDVTVGVVGKSEVFEELQAIAAGKPSFKVMALESSADLSKCQIVYVDKAASKSSPGYITSIAKQSILLVTDEREIAGKGSDISFYLEDAKLRFMISDKSIKSKSMMVSSKLLALGTPADN